MQYSDYMALYQAQKEREAQLVQQYSNKPEPIVNKGLWTITSVERHQYPDAKLWLRVMACGLIFGGIILFYCVFA